ncbi:conserved hypothetical protein [delta proteobacterium NaphS2]|nr:conserved hypothetical protein [delta proteobacterium NaphS2]
MDGKHPLSFPYSRILLFKYASVNPTLFFENTLWILLLMILYIPI